MVKLDVCVTANVILMYDLACGRMVSWWLVYLRHTSGIGGSVPISTNNLQYIVQNNKTSPMDPNFLGYVLLLTIDLTQLYTDKWYSEGLRPKR